MAKFLLINDVVNEIPNDAYILAPSSDHEAFEKLEGMSEFDTQVVLKRHIFPELGNIQELDDDKIIEKHNLNNEMVVFSKDAKKSTTICTVKLNENIVTAEVIGQKITVPNGIIFKVNKLLM